MTVPATFSSRFHQGIDFILGKVLPGPNIFVLWSPGQLSRFRGLGKGKNFGWNAQLIAPPMVSLSDFGALMGKFRWSDCSGFLKIAPVPCVSHCNTLWGYMSAQEDYLNVRIDSELKAALQAAADREGRSVGNLVKHLIRQYCGNDLYSASVRQDVAPYRVGRRKKK